MKNSFLWILPYFPYPLLSGGNVRVFNLIKYLSESYDIHLISYIEDDTKEEDIREVSRYCTTLKCIKRDQREGPLPMIFQCYDTPEMRDAIEEALSEKYSFIQIDFLTMAHYARLVRSLSSTPIVFTEHDVSWMDFEKCFHNRHLDEKARYAEWVRIVKEAGKLYELFDLVITVSDRDSEIIRERYPSKRVASLPTGTDCAHYTYSFDENNTDMIYTGHYVHYPNVAAVNYILEEVLPLVKKSLPEVKFYIAGSAGENVFKEVSDKSVVVTGTVDNLLDSLRLAGIFLAPVKMGIGIRGKILESMAAGLPVVTTSIGAEGIGARDGSELLSSDTPEGFARKVVELARDKSLRKKLSEAGRKFVEDNYDWPIRAEELKRIYERIR